MRGIFILVDNFEENLKQLSKDIGDEIKKSR